MKESNGSLKTHSPLQNLSVCIESNTYFFTAPFHGKSRDEKEETRKRHPFLGHVAGVQLMEKVKKPCHFLLR